MTDIPVLKSVTIGVSREAAYAFWRDRSNLPQLMENVERIEVIDERRAHWVVKAPAGKMLEWDSLITEDEPGRRIAWESSEDADLKNAGFIEFRDAPPGRGVEVHAHMVYDPPAGKLGEWIGKLFSKEPGVEAHRALRRMKMLLETGEIATTEAPDAAPRAHAGPV